MNYIYVSDDFDDAMQKIKSKHENVSFFISKNPPYEFILGSKKNESNPCNAREILRQSYISQSRLKTMVILAKSFKIEAMNYMLKSFEEPPLNIEFIIITPSLNLLLDTVKSRFIIKKGKACIKKRELINLKQIDLAGVLDFIKANERNQDEQGKLISNLLFSASNYNIRLSEEELEIFYKASELSRVNTRSYTYLIPILLSILKRRK